MKTFAVPTREQVAPASQEIFDNLTSALGRVPNLYATIGYSPTTLGAFLAFSDAVGKASFTAKEVEAIKLAVAEANGCEYCKAAHTAIGKMQGFTEEETLELRAGTIEDPRLRVLTRLAASIADNRGRADDTLVSAFFDAGWNEEAFIDLIGVVIAITLTNYTHILTQIPVDFPAAKDIGELTAA